MDFFEFLSTKFAACSKPTSRENHQKALSLLSKYQSLSATSKRVEARYVCLIIFMCLQIQYLTIKKSKLFYLESQVREVVDVLRRYFDDEIIVRIQATCKSGHQRCVVVFVNTRFVSGKCHLTPVIHN